MSHAPRLGIFGGTFDPVHNGHIAAAQAAVATLALDRVFFLPAACSPLKTETFVTPAADRLQMLARALKPYPIFTVDRFDIDRPPPSFTIDALRHFFEEFPPPSRLFFLIGADALTAVGSWKECHALFQYTEFAVFPRAGLGREAVASLLLSLPVGYGFDATEEVWRCGDPESCFKDVAWIPMPEIQVSATAIRQCAATGGTISSMVPQSVAEYIRTHRLYRSL